MEDESDYLGQVLPFELSLQILFFLPLQEIVQNTSLVNHQWKLLTENDLLWHRLFQAQWPVAFNRLEKEDSGGEGWKTKAQRKYQINKNWNTKKIQRTVDIANLKGKSEARFVNNQQQAVLGCEGLRLYDFEAGTVLKTAAGENTVNKVRRMEEDVLGNDGVVVSCGDHIGLWWFNDTRSQEWQPISVSVSGAEDVRASLIHNRIGWVDARGFHLVDMETGKILDDRLAGHGLVALAWENGMAESGRVICGGNRNLFSFDIRESPSLVMKSSIDFAAQCINLVPEKNTFVFGGCSVSYYDENSKEHESIYPIHEWDTREFKFLRQIGFHKNLVWDLQVSPEDNRMVSGGGAGFLHVWDYEAGETDLWPVTQESLAIHSVDFTEDKLLAAHWTGGVFVHHLGS